MKNCKRQNAMKFTRLMIGHYQEKTNMSLLIILILFTSYVSVSFGTKSRILPNDFLLRESCSQTEDHRNFVDKYYAMRKNWKTSNLGSIMFKNIDPEVFIHESRINKTFTVLLWKHWIRLSPSSAYKFNKTRVEDFSRVCSVKNCIFTGNKSSIRTADAVVVQGQKGQYPKLVKRNLNQRWIFYSDEDPMNSIIQYNASKLEEFANIFNWTMTYRTSADIPVPNGRTIPRAKPIPVQIPSSAKHVLKKLVPYMSKKKSDVPIAVLISNCNKERMSLLNELQRHIFIDVYGRCGTTYKNACPGHFRKDCLALRKYYFYLVLEDTSCKQYLTEKVFQHAYSKGSIPIIIGPPYEDCVKLLPPNSFIHIDELYSMNDMSIEIRKITLSPEKLLFYHEWRTYFKVNNEHGYFETDIYHYCRICEALNYNDGEISSYDLDKLVNVFDAQTSCSKLREIEPISQTEIPL